MAGAPAAGLSFRDGAEEVIVIDGGLATLLETKYKCDLNHKLWSTKILEENPDLIRDAHADFLIEGGCDLIITCTYQTSVGGFDGDAAKFESSVQTALKMANAAREKAVAARGGSSSRPIWIAGSLGSYGASLCCGEEYSGEYGLPEGAEGLRALREFHLPRMRAILAARGEGGGADLLAAETIPVAREAALMSRLFAEFEAPGYVSFSCKSWAELGSGESIEEAVRGLCFGRYLVGVGVNCTSVKYVAGLVAAIKRALDEARPEFRPRILAYPNSGEVYDGASKAWREDPELGGRSFAELGREWFGAGATALGGCCRVSPEQIRELRGGLLPPG